jgi:hypothetical protein
LTRAHDDANPRLSMVSHRNHLPGIDPSMYAKYAIFAASLLAPALAGCSDDPFQIAPVSGRVTLNGEPLADARVSFQPISDGKDVGPDSSATTDAQGNYSLATHDGRRGATVGSHRVRISTLKLSADPSKDDAGYLIRMSRPDSVVVPEKVPAKYSKEIPLTTTVPPGGTSTANFELSGEPPPPPKKGGQPPKGVGVTRVGPREPK